MRVCNYIKIRSLRSALVCLGSLLAALCLLQPASALAQFIWSMDFESWPVGTGPILGSQGSPPPTATALVTDIGGEHGHILTLSVDSSSCTGPWESSWDIYPRNFTVTGYVPERTYVSFEAMVSKLQPIRVKLEYTLTAEAVRNLETRVYPRAVGSFERFVIPLSAFDQTFFWGNPPDYPTAIEVGIEGNPSVTDSLWGCDTDNVLSTDNITYYVLPPSLKISADNGNLLITWPTNATPYVLQESMGPSTSAWTDVLTPPTVTNAQNQIAVSPSEVSHFYRLRSP